MAADIYTMFRRFIGDFTPDYTLPDLETLAFLDLGIDEASSFLNKTISEDVVITSADITAGYKTLSYDIVTILDTDLGLWNENIYWQTDGTDKIYFIDTDSITAGTYNVRYRARYKKFEGVVRENSYFNYPRQIDLGIVFWALAEYQSVKGIINADNSANIITSKSEEGMSVSYGTASMVHLSSPSELKKKAIEIFNGASNNANINFSVTV